MSEIPKIWRERSPLMGESGWEFLQAIRQHASAPKWNFETGDRTNQADLQSVEGYRSFVAASEHASAESTPPPDLCEQVSTLRDRSWFFEERIPVGLALERDWAALPTMSRDDLATRLVEVVPHDISDLDRMIVYDTSGSTGHAVHVPHDPAVLGKSHVLAERAMRANGVEPAFRRGEIECVNLCAQQSTYVFAAVFAVWNGSGFVKVNLNEDDWAGGREAARTYLALSPQLLTSDPVSLAVGMEWGIELRPRAILSTALALSPAARDRYAEYYGCPVIDWYSTTETGPIAFAVNDGWELVAPDMFVEVIDDEGRPVEDGVTGELCVTTLRNPFLPLVRYRTGDRAALQRGARPWLTQLSGRRPVRYRHENGETVSSVDVGRAMRLVAHFAQHNFHQDRGGACTLRLRPLPKTPVAKASIVAALRRVLGGVPLSIEIDEELGLTEKVPAYTSDL